MSDKHRGFLASPSREKAIEWLRQFHAVGMEGHLVELKGLPVDPGDDDTLYGVRVVWPEDWTDEDIHDCIEGLSKGYSDET